MFKDRVSEGDVGRILQLIADAPNSRERPIPGDLNGSFDFWFDGGAALIITGWTEYYFADGTRATVGGSSLLSVAIKLPDGSCVSVRQIGKEDSQEFIRENRLR